MPLLTADMTNVRTEKSAKLSVSLTSTVTPPYFFSPSSGQYWQHFTCNRSETCNLYFTDHVLRRWRHVFILWIIIISFKFHLNNTRYKWTYANAARLGDKINQRLSFTNWQLVQKAVCWVTNSVTVKQSDNFSFYSVFSWKYNVHGTQSCDSRKCTYRVALYPEELTLLCSTSLVSMTIRRHFFCQIILQKSGTNSSVGPVLKREKYNLSRSTRQSHFYYTSEQKKIQLLQEENETFLEVLWNVALNLINLVP